jgi:transcriptional regulator with XRE-family HTH domain
MVNSENPIDEALLKSLGTRIARIRIALNLTQEQLATQAGLGLRTIQRLELGATATQLSGFIRVCRVLGLIDGFDTLIPEPALSPVAQLKLRGKERKRASQPRTEKPSANSTTWQWADEDETGANANAKI